MLLVRMQESLQKKHARRHMGGHMSALLRTPPRPIFIIHFCLLDEVTTSCRAADDPLGDALCAQRPLGSEQVIVERHGPPRASQSSYQTAPFLRGDRGEA